MSNKTQIRTVCNLFAPMKNTQLHEVEVGTTIGEWVDANGWIKNQPRICLFNGEPLLREFWPTKEIEKDSIVVFVEVPMGSGGSRRDAHDGKDPLQILIGVGLIVGGIATGGFTTALGASLLGFGGAIAASGLLPIPEIPSPDQGNNLASSSPTYTPNAQNNLARIGEAIPVIYGEHYLVPDYCEAPYLRYEGNKKVLYQYLMVGQGEIDVSDVKFGDVLATDLPGVEVNHLPIGQIATPHPSNVHVSKDIVGLEIDTTSAHAETPAVQLSRVGTSFSTAVFNISAPNGVWKRSGSDTVAHSVKLFIKLQRIDDDGNDLGQAVISQHTISGDKPDPIHTRVSRTVQAIAGIPGIPRAKVSFYTEGTHLDGADGNQIIVIDSVLLFDETFIDYGQTTRLQIKSVASEGLASQNNTRISCIAKRKIPTWSPAGGWTAPVFSKSIVWAFSDAVRNGVYGAKWTSDNLLDLDGLYALDKILSARGDEFNGVFDRRLSLWEALRLIARAGRCVPILQGGILHMIRDRQQIAPVAMFTTRNMLKDSFKIQYSMANEDTADGFTVQYIDPLTWKSAEVSVNSTGGVPDNPTTVQLFGCTNKDHAMREALYLSRNNDYRRKKISFSTEMDGFIPAFGDKIVVQHDMPGWGACGDVIGLEGSDVVLSEEFPGGFTAEGEIAFRLADGSLTEFMYVKNTRSDGTLNIVGLGYITFIGEGRYVDGNYQQDLDQFSWKCLELQDLPHPELFNSSCILTEFKREKRGADDGVPVATGRTIPLFFDGSQEKTQYIIRTTESVSQNCIVKSIKPRGQYKVEIECVNEDDRVHAD